MVYSVYRDIFSKIIASVGLSFGEVVCIIGV